MGDSNSQFSIAALLFGLLGNAVWAALASAATTLVLYSIQRRSQFNGRWRVMIHWNADWAKQRLLGCDTDDPNSVGELSLSFGFGPRRDQYWGLSYWTLRDGADIKASLCVEFSSILVKRFFSSRLPFVNYQLISAHLDSRIRKEIDTFRYPGKFANYGISFTTSSVDQLLGNVMARIDPSSPAVTVGSFKAERLA